MSALRNKMLELKLDESFTVRQLLADLETLSEIRFAGRYGKLLTETTKAQREMMEGFVFLEGVTAGKPGFGTVPKLLEFGTAS